MVLRMRVLLVCSVVLITGVLMSGCALSYYWQAAAGQLELLNERLPITAVLNDPAQSAAIREALARTLEMRQFAVAELGLPDNDSYRSYVDLGRPYVVWNVVVAEEFSVEPRRWCFPVAGCVTYRGYFHKTDAERYAERLSAAGFDVYVAGARAYSTLGYFSDPILSTMLTGGEQTIAAVLFHELAHQLFYVKDDTELNEAFATAIEEYGTQQWLLREGDRSAVEAYRRKLQRREDFNQLIARQQTRLRALYGRPGTPETMRAAKREAFETLTAEFTVLRAAWGGASDYDAWFSRPLNNAQLASVATYGRWLPNLREYLGSHGLDALYAEMKLLEDLPREARQTRLAALSATPFASELR
ncbi:MAG: aminopeptidase [Gammaproteobacteria bacterium]|nr:MAG: aminopeptidase [Gammaproteobacteria bacterium]